MIWFTSDTHFGHKKIIEYSNRPFDGVDEMNAEIIAQWNRCISPRDTVYHLGDFAFSNHLEIFSTLNGNKNLIVGNHDKKPTLRLPWGWVKDNYSLKIEGTYIFLHHYACRVWNRSSRGSIHLYGHSHGSLPRYGRSMDVGVDAVAGMTGIYRPISLDEVAEHLKDC